MTLDATAKKVISQVKEDFLVRFASDLIKIPSFKTEETRVAKYIANFLKRRGYKVDLQEVDPGRFQTIATLKGTGRGKTLMLNGHIDIDPLATGWKRDPWAPTVEDDRLYGAGIYNMKGGITSMVAAAEAIRKSKVLIGGDLQIACVVGELQGGIGTVRALEKGYRPDMAIVAEPNGSDTLLTTHAGWIELAINVIGDSRHISQKEEANHAIIKMSKVVQVINNLKLSAPLYSALPKLPRIMVGSVIGGLGRDYILNGPNFTSDFCTALVDARLVPGQTADSVVADVRNALEGIKAQDPDFKYEVEMPPDPRHKVLLVNMDPMEVPTSEYIVQAVARNYQALTGKKPAHIGVKLPNSYSGNDTCHIWKAGIPCVLYGPTGGWRERPDEPDAYISIREMKTCAQVIALTALEVCNQA